MQSGKSEKTSKIALISARRMEIRRTPTKRKLQSKFQSVVHSPKSENWVNRLSIVRVTEQLLFHMFVYIVHGHYVRIRFWCLAIWCRFIIFPYSSLIYSNQFSDCIIIYRITINGGGGVLNQNFHRKSDISNKLKLVIKRKVILIQVSCINLILSNRTL